MNKQQQGFTLIEVLVAVTILGLAYVAVLQNFSTSLRNITRLEEAGATLMEDVLSFEHRMWRYEQGDAPDLEKENDFFVGTKYRLVGFANRNGTFKTFRIERLQL